MDVSTQQSFHQLSKEEGQWITYWQHHPHLPRWHAQTAIRHVRDQQLLHYVHDVWSGTPFDQQNHNNDDDHYQVPEVWTTAAAVADGAAAASPRTSGVRGAVDEDELVLRCLMHRNSDLLNNESASSTSEEAAAITTTTGSSSTNESCSRNDISGGGQGEARASSSGPTTSPQSSHTSPAVLFSALSQYFSCGDQNTGRVPTGRASGTMKHFSSLSADNGANVPHVRSASSSSLFIVRFQSQAANGLVGVWFRRLRRPPQPAAAGGCLSNKGDAVAGMTTNNNATANASGDVDKSLDEQITAALTAAGLSAWWSIAPSNVLRRLSDAYRSLAATTEASAASDAVSSRKDSMADADVLLSAGRWLTPSRLFPDALALQGSMVQLMRRAPFIHPHGAVQEIFEVFGPCSVREWRHHTQRSGGGGGKSRSAPCFLITFTGERPQLSKDDTVDIENDGSDDAIRKLRRQQAASLRRRRSFAAEDASFALAQLQRFFAVDWGLTLTYQFGSGARRQIDAENDLVDVDEEERAVARDPPASTGGEATVSCDDELQTKESTSVDVAVDAVDVELDGMTTLKPKRKLYVAPSSSAISSHQEPQQHQHEPQHIPQLMCPLDGSCTQINDPDHQQVYLHRCTLPAPCVFQANPLHGPYFLH